LTARRSAARWRDKACFLLIESAAASFTSPLAG
jgi:hypothetical protein